MKPCHAFRTSALLLALHSGTSLAADPSDNHWPSYNRSLTSERHSPLEQIDRNNVAQLKLLCTYDTGQTTGFQSGLIEIEGQLIGTTETDIFALNPDTCTENWRTHEDTKAGSPLHVNRGAAYLDGRLFRGTQDGRVLAYDSRSGLRMWEARIADGDKHETVPAAPIAWQGMVFIGTAGGDYKGVKGRMYGLDASTGAIVWETYLVPKTASDPSRGASAPQPADFAASWGVSADVPITGGGSWGSYSFDTANGMLYVPVGNAAPDFNPRLRPGDNLLTGSVAVLDARTGQYLKHYTTTPADFHDWDTASAPILLTSRAGQHLLAVTPKDGYLHTFDLISGKRLYRTPLTTMLNTTEVPTATGTRFCPGSQGGSEWNGPAYDAARNLIFSGQVDWCVTVRTVSDDATRAVANYEPWTGSPKEDFFGRFDPPTQWAGRFAAIDADSGKLKWRFQAPNPLLSGVVSTASGLVLFGDMGGNLFALDADSGKTLWTQKVSGALGGGIITYATTTGQRIAVAAGMTSLIWPTEKTTAKVLIFGLPAATSP